MASGSGTSSRKHMRDHDVVPPSTRYIDGEWETKEALLQRELEEARSRAAQMEKTMRWWSDCTANWREKWSKIRNERNHVREEVKTLRSKLEFAVKDANASKYEYQELELQNEHLKKEIEKVHTILLKYAGQFEQQIISILESDPELKNALGIHELLKMYNNVSYNETQTTNSKEIYQEKNMSKIDTVDPLNRDIEEYVLQGAVPKHAVELYKEDHFDQNNTKAINSSTIDNIYFKKETSVDESDENTKSENIALLEHTAEMLKLEISRLQEECNELQKYKNEAMKEVMNLKSEAINSRNDLDDEADNRDRMDRRISELCAELEKLQTENAAEWGKRERLESEKLSLERQNKLLRVELNEMKEKVDAQRVRPISSRDADKRILQQEFLDCNKELSELKKSHVKLKKLITEKTTDLSHALRRSEQYEVEVKKVRLRVEELKKELAMAQDEVDTVTTSFRKLQRVNEDLVEQLEVANVQIERLQEGLEMHIPDTVTKTNDDKCNDNNEGIRELL